MLIMISKMIVGSRVPFWRSYWSISKSKLLGSNKFFNKAISCKLKLAIIITWTFSSTSSQWFWVFSIFPISLLWCLVEYPSSQNDHQYVDRVLWTFVPRVLVPVCARVDGWNSSVQSYFNVKRRKCWVASFSFGGRLHGNRRGIRRVERPGLDQSRLGHGRRAHHHRSHDRGRRRVHRQGDPQRHAGYPKTRIYINLLNNSLNER